MTNDLNLGASEAAEDLRKLEKPAATPGLASKAVECAREMSWVPGKTSQLFAERLKALDEQMQEVLSSTESEHLDVDERRWLRENRDFLRSEVAALQEATGALERTEHVRRGAGKPAPRVLVLSQDLLATVRYRFDDRVFTEYLRAFQNVVVLRLSELWELVPALKLVLLERVAARTTRSSNATTVAEGSVGDCIRSLHAIRETPWEEILEPLIVFDQVLRRDPAGAYPKMDPENRDQYRKLIVKLAEHSDHSELEIAEMVLTLASESLRKPSRNPRVVTRRSHVGYYLVAEGREQLDRRASVRLPWRDRFQAFLRRHPDEFYPLGVEVLTLGMILLLLWWVNFSSLWSTLIAVLLLLIPCSQSAVEIMNFLTTSLLDPQLLPKLDFSHGIPDNCATMVVVPTLLLNEKQVRETVEELEVRYVGNMSANLHFALLTDLGDSTEQPREDDPLVDLCGGLVGELNRKYAGKGTGGFAMFHRHRVYNRREGLWIGWERKRGKLLDFNKLILGSYDSFPFKVGDLSVLPKIRYVLTLDSDTQLPRGSAHKLIGAMAHPLCQAIIDSEKNIVTQGYGILQPRVGISVQSTARSRLASIYSDWTGLDIYTQAVSDVYQDLYGEGSFVGKGLYEVRTLHRVLDGRFPRNQILSHDLIEGAYTRAGLATDVKIIDSYPSHYSAYARRKHRWMRGDWQNVEWLLSKVPNESGRWVPNPISLISRWKILDNLRRTMVEPVTVAVFLLVWKLFPGKPLYWTLALMGVLFAPIAVQFIVGLVRAGLAGNFASVKNLFASVATGAAGILLSFAFRVHDALLSTDAIWRTIYRRFVSRQRLLQWETAAEAEVGKKKRTPVDLYLLWTPAIVAAMGLALYYTRRPAFWVALPILMLWGCSSLIPLWLDRPPRVEKPEPSRKDELFVRRASLRTWRYFSEFSTEEHNWLIPDNVQEDPPQVAARVSPTNLGLLLNARQVACELGYLTVPELVTLTRRTLDTMKRLQLHRGHLVNWYDTRSLVPLEPRFVSSVDSGNLAASLVALNHGCRALLGKPLLSRSLVEGYNDHIRALADFNVLSSWKATRAIRTRKNQPLLKRVASVIADPLVSEDSKDARTGAPWFGEQLQTRRKMLRNLLHDYMPWLLPEFEPVRRGLAIENSAINVPLSKLSTFLRGLQEELQSDASHGSGSDEERELRRHLLTLVVEAQGRTDSLLQELLRVADDADAWFAGMDFGFLLDQRRKLLSIGYDASAGKLHSACYDLLASEARIAAFIGIAKGELPQEVWLRLGRKHVATVDGPALISWAGTMFEYLMPAIWTGSYRDSVLLCSMERAVAEQQSYAAKKGVPWGISESSFSDLNEEGVYGYRFFGVPDLAMQSSESERVVIAPYATAMALSVDPTAALRNLRVMINHGWFGQYGFYESADFGPAEAQFRSARLVKSWMAHHQGMILLSMANFLRGDIVQKWFHSDVYVQATDLLLQERMAVLRANRRKRKKKSQPASSPTPKSDSGLETVRGADGNQPQVSRRS
jgi:hypothetical protein